MADVWANSISSQSHLPHCRVLPPGEFSGMSSQNHISHCRVLPLGEFTVMAWFQSHMQHCRVQSPGEINVMIVPHCRVWEFYPPFVFRHILFSSCGDENNAKQRVFLGRLLVARLLVARKKVGCVVCWLRKEPVSVRCSKWRHFFDRFLQLLCRWRFVICLPIRHWAAA